QTIVKLKYERGMFIPQRPIPELQEGDVIEFILPDAGTVYLCETDRIAAMDSGHVIWTPGDSINEGEQAPHDLAHS
ncbi:MAG TPA: hypothetical protein VKQ72_02070, partial [Aggregatilineales bacterium]|nr:hypothetical protein [Aggregatilineales bacterium]